MTNPHCITCGKIHTGDFCPRYPADIVQQTWSQYLIKAELGAWRGCQSLRERFHWKFWKPIDAIGGKIYFGRYVEYDRNEGRR